MRRLSLVSLVLTPLVLLGCNSLRDAFTPRADVVARANDQTLSVERMATWASSGKQVPLDPMAFSRLSHIWVDYSLFAQALAAGQNLNDSATMLSAMWPVVSQLKWEHFHDKLNAATDFSDKQVDSAYEAGAMRIFQHILFQVPPSAAPNVDAQKRRQAEQLLPQARSAGARFAQLASRYSDDPGSKTQGGSLGLSGHGQFVAAFEDAAWQLAPGGVSTVIKSPFGYHIIRRPPLAEVRDSFRTGIEERLQFHGDSVYLDSLTIKRRIEPVSRAPAYVRQDPGQLPRRLCPGARPRALGGRDGPVGRAGAATGHRRANQTVPQGDHAARAARQAGRLRQGHAHARRSAADSHGARLRAYAARLDSQPVAGSAARFGGERPARPRQLRHGASERIHGSRGAGPRPVLPGAALPRPNAARARGLERGRGRRAARSGARPTAAG